jgi:hypothetical protein
VSVGALDSSVPIPCAPRLRQRRLGRRAAAERTYDDAGQRPIDALLATDLCGSSGSIGPAAECPDLDDE